ncbi:hypothetical protein [Saccharibacillus deserti]|uniref:hypothetical protein n=1 Tax=Saccharibacillus deserti TaxID=1634444 RepID=UPI001553F311|nr:hypothetical protein [Saccharibacillus deserti]
MQQPHCAYHPDREARHQCTHCGRMLCDECYNPATKSCIYKDCTASGMPSGEWSAYREDPRDRPGRQPGDGSWSSNPGCQIVISILAIIGGLFMLLLAICGGMIFFNY